MKQIGSSEVRDSASHLHSTTKYPTNGRPTLTQASLVITKQLFSGESGKFILEMHIFRKTYFNEGRLNACHLCIIYILFQLME